MDRSAEKRFRGRTRTIEPTSQHETLPLHPTKSYPVGWTIGWRDTALPMISHPSRQNRPDRPESIACLSPSWANMRRATELHRRGGEGCDRGRRDWRGWEPMNAFIAIQKDLRALGNDFLSETAPDAGMQPSDRV